MEHVPNVPGTTEATEENMWNKTRKNESEKRDCFFQTLVIGLSSATWF